MKVKVVMPFNDKVTGKVCKVGDIIDVTDKRLAEIKKAGRFVVPVDDKNAVKESLIEDVKASK